MNLLKATTLTAALSASAAATAGGIPVFDTVQNATAIVNQVETIAKWKVQADQMIAQIKRMEMQYEALTGSRSLGQVLNNPLLRDYLPENWRDLYRKLQTAGVTLLGGTGQTIYQNAHVFDRCAFLVTDIQKLICEAKSIKGAMDQGMALDSYEKAELRVDQIKGLMEKIDKTEDPKGIAELQGRLAAEQANIENESTKLQLYSMVSEAADKIQEQREAEVQAMTWNAEETADVAPLTFATE